MQVCDLVCFSKERYFNGAVQTEWFYDQSRVQNVATSYVFHGPKYFGVSDGDINYIGYRLIDTASFTLNIAKKLYDKKLHNSLVMTIAGYGAGKSHLAVSLAALFSGKQNLVNGVTDNIKKADREIAEEIEKINYKKNFVIVLNGMNNFNLDAEILRCTRQTLAQNDLKDDFLRRITKAYDIAKRFVDKTFQIYQEQFEIEANLRGITLNGEQLKKYILDNIETSEDIISLVNAIYTNITGDSIRWERGLSAGDILTEVYNQLCGEEKPFNKILIIFDEFGRYIEYAATNPTVAGEAALQQIFEAVQSADGGIVFLGFIQNELNAYLARIEKTSNIMRYIGRYTASENLFLSSNFETILANLLQKNNEKAYDRVLDGSFAKYEYFQASVKRAIQRWDRSTIKKSVWLNDALYKSVIMKGCYPLHPITVWLLANINNWMQQRSAITFAAEMVDKISEAEIDGIWLPYIYPIDIVDSSIYNEMLNSEEKGLVKSQYCMLYRDIQTRIGDKLSENENKVLKAALIVNIGRFSFLNKEDAITALGYCTNLKKDELTAAVKRLENFYGVVFYDEVSNTFDLIAEANGFNEFKRVYNRYRINVKAATIDDCDETIREELSLNSYIETSFAQQHHISSVEWRFKQTLMDAALLSEANISRKLEELDNDYSGDGYRGEIIFAYCSTNLDQEIKRLASLHKKLRLSISAILIIFLDDSEGEMIEALTIKNVLNRFSNADNDRFQKHIQAQHKAQNKKIIKRFNALVQMRSFIVDDGLMQYQGRLNSLCTARFEDVYNCAVPFMFDGFENKTQTAARRYLVNICTKMFDKTLTNIQSYNALPTDEKNRIKSCLLLGGTTSWQVYDSTCAFIKPVNIQVLKIFEIVEEILSDGKCLNFMQAFGRFTKAPYGMNINSIVLFFFYYISFKNKQVLCFWGNERLRPVHVSDNLFKGGKIQSREFIKIRIQKNSNMDVDLVKDLCDEIMSCTEVEKCQNYKKQLDELLAQESILPGDQLNVASAKTRLDDGIKLRDDIYNKLKKGQEIIAEARKNFGIQKFVRVFTYVVDTEAPVSPALPFVYSDYYKRQMDVLKEDIHFMLEKKGSDAINKFSCKLTQLSQFKVVCKNISTILQSQGYEELAETLKKHALGVEEDLLAKQKYESALVDLDKDISMVTNVSEFGYTSCILALEKMKGWECFFSNIVDVPENLWDLQRKKIAKIIDEISERMEDISRMCQKEIDSISEMTTGDQITQAKDKLDAMLALGLNEEDGIMVNACLRDIISAIKKIESLPENIDELGQTIVQIKDTSYGCCSLFVLASMDAKMLELEKKQATWVEHFIIPILQKNIEMSVIDCSTWLDKTSNIPVFLSQKTLEQYKRAKLIVEQRLHKGRVEGVIVMYDKLSEDEKTEFRRMINLAP